MTNGIHSLMDQFKMLYLMNFRDFSFFQNCFFMLFILFFTYVLTNESLYYQVENYIRHSLHSMYSTNKRSIVLEGKHCFRINSYRSKTDNIFSDRFQAFWFFICKTNIENQSVFCIKEYFESEYDDDYLYSNNINREKPKNYYIVDQPFSFHVKDDIHCKVTKRKDNNDDKSRKVDIENITIEIYSYVLSLRALHDFLEELDLTYKKYLQEKRNSKKFIYTLIAPSKQNIDCERHSKSNHWQECEFNSTRHFGNLFFENKEELIRKLDFFCDHPEWYHYEGHPWTLGIGLHGPPGTGKTSVIKCIANKLQRHIIVIPLNKIKTQSEFNEYFFEQYYSHQNRNKIGFENKIIVFEDIDCMTNIVKKRQFNVSNAVKQQNMAKFDQTNSQIEKNMALQSKILNKIAQKVDVENENLNVIEYTKETSHDEITLSYILNVIDGIRETPGRILIITSNDYDSLDPALVRPGRIDITLEMKNASIKTMKEMYTHYYNDTIPEQTEIMLKDYIVSPAKLVNLRLSNTKAEDFIQALEQEFR